MYCSVRDDGDTCADLYESAFRDVIERMVKNKEERIQIMLGVEAYKQKKGKFGSEMEKEAIEFLQPSIYDFFRK